MTAPNTITNGRGADIDAWKQRLGAGCARFYAHLSVVTFALVVFAYDASEPNSSVRYGNLWQEVARTGHSDEVVAVLIFFIGCMLLTAPGLYREPALTEAGVLDVALSLLSVAVFLGHEVTLIILDFVESRRR